MKTSKTCLCRLLVAMALVMWLGNVGTAVTVTLGDQDFINGSFPDGVSGFNGPSAGEPVPFDQFRGGDFSIPFSESWTFNYPALTVTSATLTLGIFDHDSRAPGSQINSFTVDAVDITSVLDTQFESSGGTQNEYNVYTVNLPASTFSALSDGTATFTLTLKGPGLEDSAGSTVNTTISNGAGLDFAMLSVIPEPATLILLGLGGVALLRKRKV